MLKLPQSLHLLTLDGRLLFATRIARLFAYGFLSVVPGSCTWSRWA